MNVVRDASKVPADLTGIWGVLSELHRSIREEVHAWLRQSVAGSQSRAVGETVSDVRYAIDVPAEEIVDHVLTRTAFDPPVVVVAEGLGRRTYGSGGGAPWWLLIDPLDGTRGLMNGLRSAWVLTAIAPPSYDTPSLIDVIAALQTEVGPLHQSQEATAWAFLGRGAWRSISTLEETGNPERLAATSERTVAGGFAPVVRYFHGHDARLGELADGIAKVAAKAKPGREALVFDDQYISTGGQLYLLATGQYRAVVDFRASVASADFPTLSAHPYDLASELIAREAGAVVTNPDGSPLSFPFDVETECAWVGYGNDQIRRELEPVVSSFMLRQSAGADV